AVETTSIDIQPHQSGIGCRRIDALQTLDGSEVADPAQEAHRNARGAARAARDLGRTIGPEVNVEEARPAAHDLFELCRFVKGETQRDTETLTQRPGYQAGPGGRPYQGEGGEIDPYRPRGRSLADDEVELKILHGRIEDFLYRRHQAMDLVDEQDIARLQIGQQGSEIAAALDDRAGSGAKADPHLSRHDMRKGRLAETRRAREEHVIEGLTAGFRR